MTRCTSHSSAHKVFTLLCLSRSLLNMAIMQPLFIFSLHNILSQLICKPSLGLCLLFRLVIWVLPYGQKCELGQGQWYNCGGNMGVGGTGLPAYTASLCPLMLLGLDPRCTISLLRWTAAGLIWLWDLVGLITRSWSVLFTDLFQVPRIVPGI